MENHAPIDYRRNGGLSMSFGSSFLSRKPATFGRPDQFAGAQRLFGERDVKPQRFCPDLAKKIYF
jgi:hypothetical protein